MAKQGVIVPAPLRKSILQGALFTEGAFMDISEENLEKLVDGLKQINNEADDLSCQVSDISDKLEKITTIAEVLLDVLAVTAQQAKQGSALSHPAQP